MLQNTFKKFFLIFLLLELFLTYTPAFAIPTSSGYDYGTEAHVSDQIRQYLCAPTPPKENQTNNFGSGTGNSINPNQAAYGNANSSDLYLCINQMYKFAIVVASVVGVFFIVIAGYVYISSEGNAESVEKAKSILTSTIASLVILFGGYVFLKAINPDLIQFHSVQPPSIKISDLNKLPPPVPINTAFDKLNTIPNDFPVAEVRGCKSQTGTLEGNYFHYSQCTGSWASTPYSSSNQVCKEDDGSQSTIGTSACGPTSLATVLKNFGKDVDPPTIANLVIQKNGRICGAGTTFTSLDQIAQSYGMATVGINDVNAALTIVKNGGVVIAAMGPGIFTSGGHYITIYGMSSDGNYLIADSGPRNITKASAQNIIASFRSGMQVK